MNCGNRKFVIKNPLLVLPVSLLLLGQVHAEPPKIGKQPGSRKTTAVKPGPLLGGLFGGDTGLKKDDENRKATPINEPRDISWEGIPFHTPKKSTARITSSTPIRDPGLIPKPPRSVPARTASTRMSRPATTAVPNPPPTVNRQPALKPVPRVAAIPQTVRVAPKSSTGVTTTLSDRSSSRRSSRRDVSKLEMQEPAANADRYTDTMDLVPRVSRKAIGGDVPQVQDQAKTPDATAKPEPSVAAAPAPAPVARKTPVPSATVEPKTSMPATQPAAPAASPLTKPDVPVQPTVPAKAPEAIELTPAPAITVPAPPAAQATPEPTAPVILSNPEMNSSQPNDFEPRKREARAISAPIGSGVRVDSDAAYRKPEAPTPYVAQQPQYQTFAPVPTAPVADPYAAQDLTPPKQTNTIPTNPVQTFEVPTTMPEPAIEEETTSPVVEIAADNNVVASELPGIRVLTNGPSSIMIRQTHQFEIRVENRGSIDAAGVMVRARIPDWAEVRGQTASRGKVEPTSSNGLEHLSWKIESLPAGTSERMFVRLRALESGTHGLDVDWTLLPQKSVAKIQVHQPELKLTIEGPDQVVYGESQAYRVRVLNPGDGVAPNVVFTLSPNSATPQTQRIGDIPSGKEAQFEVELTAMDLGNLKIHGLAAGDLELRAESQKQIRVVSARLEAVLTGPEIKYRDSEADYHLQLENTGSVDSKNVQAQIRLPVGASYVGGLEGAVQRGNMLTWTIDNVAPGAILDYKFRCKLNASGDQLIAFDCKGSAAGQANVSISTRVESVSDLVMTINDPAAPAPVGSEVTYEVVIRNRGSKEAKDVRAIAQFSHGIEPRRASGHPNEVVTGQVLFDTIPKIDAGGEVRLKIVAVAERSGHHRFRTEIRSGDTVLVAEEATHYMNSKSERVSRRSSEQTKLR